MIYIRDDIPRTLLLKHIFQVTLKVYSYNSILGNANGYNLEHNIPPSKSEQYYFNNLDKSLDTYSNYEKNLLVGDFDAQTADHYFSLFLDQHELLSLVKENTCFKNFSYPGCIELFLPNSALSFQLLYLVGWQIFIIGLDSIKNFVF